MSIQLDDWPHIGAFTYRMRGFLNHTTKHYLKHYQLRLWQKVSKFYFSKNQHLDDFCNGDTKRHKILMNLLTDFKQIYNNKSLNLAIMHHVENTHDSSKRLNWLDQDLYEFLSNGHQNGLFNNTAIFLFSDHGPRFNDKRSKQRYLEERLPFFSIYLPKSFQQTYPNKIKNLILNKNILTSPFDIYATLKDLTCLNQIKETKRSISLFNRISKFRTCEEIGIPDHYCSCAQPWKSQDNNSSLIKEIALFSLQSINKLTSTVRHLCQELTLKEIISAEWLEKSNRNSMYKIEFIVMPSNGVYEVLVYERKREHFEFNSEKFSIKSRNDISRIDAYGSQPSCVAKFGNNPGQLLDLRKFCFCYKKVDIRKIKRF